MFRLRFWLLLALDVSALTTLVPDAGALSARCAHAGAWLREDVDGACIQVASAALWLLAAWVGIGLLCAALSAGPGRLAASAGVLLGRLFPAATRRLLAGAVGIGVVLAPAVATADPAPSTPASASSAPVPGWPTDGGQATGTRPAPRWPQDPPAADRAGHVTSTPPVLTGERVTVRAGDSLWLIAQRRLGSTATPPQIAAAWPRWYAANRAAVGADPSLIRPGQVLNAPAEQ